MNTQATTTALINIEQALDTLFDARLLCEVCQSQPWTQRALRHSALVCAGCASTEPERKGLRNTLLTYAVMREDTAYKDALADDDTE